MVEIAPQVNVELVLPVGWIDGLAVPDDTGHYTENLVIGNAILTSYIMVAADDVIVGADLQDAVEDVFVAMLVENCVVALAAGGGVFATDFDNVAALAEKG